jgi:hypothetical protein
MKRITVCFAKFCWSRTILMESEPQSNAALALKAPAPKAPALKAPAPNLIQYRIPI